MKTIGIIGYGIVGKATEIMVRALYSGLAKITKYSIDLPNTSLTDVIDCDFIFICVPTPSKENGECDTSIVQEVVKDLATANTKGIVVIRSTIIPGTTQNLRKKFKLRLNFMPEFLTESSYEYDAQNPALLVVGGEEKNEIENLFFQANQKRIFSSPSSIDAEMLKYMINTFFTTKVVFANEFFDICEEEKVDYNFIKNVMYRHPWVGANHLDVLHQGGRGAGGKCLNKDTKAIVAKYNTPLLKTVNDLNTKLLMESKK